MSSFSFTFTIPAFKKVYFMGKRRPYGRLSPKQQHSLIENLFIKILRSNEYSFIDWVYEFHEDKRLHIHGYIITPSDSKVDYVYTLRDDFYSYNSIIGIKMSSYLKLSDIQQTRENLDFWRSYMAKNQDKIIFKSGFVIQQEYVNNLDEGIIKIEENITPPEIDYTEYAFRGIRHKTCYEVEF